MAVVTIRQLLDSGVHFGHQTRRWNPKVKRFILTERSGIHIIDLQQSLAYIDKAYDFVKETVAHGGTILFVGTKKQAQESIAEQAGDGGVPRVIPMAQAAADSFVVHDLDVEEERALGYGQRIASAHRGEETVAAIAPDGRLAAILDERAATAKSRVTFPA